MTNSYSISRCMWKPKKTCFFTFWTFKFWSFILLTYCGSKLSHWNFRLGLVRGLIWVWVCVHACARASATDHPMGKTNPFQQSSNQTWHTIQWQQSNRKKTSSEPCVSCPQKRAKFKCKKHDGGVVFISASVCTTQIAFLKTVQHYDGKSWT
jgi:hypothetical protein